MTGFIATFGIAAAGTIVGLVIAHFSKGETTKNPRTDGATATGARSIGANDSSALRKN